MRSQQNRGIYCHTVKQTNHMHMHTPTTQLLIGNRLIA